MNKIEKLTKENETLKSEVAQLQKENHIDSFKDLCSKIDKLQEKGSVKQVDNSSDTFLDSIVLGEGYISQPKKKGVKKTVKDTKEDFLSADEPKTSMKIDNDIFLDIMTNY